MEHWKSIKGFEKYEVSNHGRIKNVKRGTIRKARLNWNGYFDLRLYSEKSERSFLVHRLVAIAFIPNPHLKNQVNHIDSNKQNNNVENLEWVTEQENTAHAVKNNLYPLGEDNANAKLKERDIISIRESVGLFSVRQLAEWHNVSVTTIERIRRRITWKHI